MAGRKPIDPSGAVRRRVVLMLTDSERASLESTLWSIRNNAGTPHDRFNPPYLTRGVNMPTTVANEREAAILKSQMPNANPPYVPSMRECSICGKDYDGNLHDSCPHEHVPNHPRKK